MFKSQRIRDPLHNLIEFRAEEFEHALWGVIQTQEFQRLRRIKQLGFSDLVYPGATHSRFAHSLGVFHTARQLMRLVREHLGERGFEDSRAERALAAALVHDIGHGPFSHAFEDVGRRLKLRMADHEHVGNAVIEKGQVATALNVLGSGFAKDVADIIKRAGPVNLYDAVVSSQFDADRLDYMQRDRLMTGTQHGAIDFRWLMANLEIGKVPFGVDATKIGSLETFVLGPKAVHAAESYVLGLFQLYPTVYFHKATRSAEKIFTELFVQVIRLIQDSSTKNTGLPNKHPLVQFAKHPERVENALRLDDTAIWGALALLADAKDPIVKDLSIRLRDRKLYKCIDVREQVRQRMGTRASATKEVDVDRVCQSVRQSIEEWISEQDFDSPRLLSDEGVREAYKRFQESKGPLNQIRIRTESDSFVDLGERSEVVGAIEPFRFYRLYSPEEDDEIRRFVEKLIDGRVEHVANG